MTDLPQETLQHIVCGLLFVSRVGDVATTYLVTPTLVLEANPIVRRLGWRYALLTVAVSAVPYFSLGVGLGILMPSLLVSASNAGKVWVARTLGERAYEEFLFGVARRSKRSQALASVLAAAAFIVLAGVVVLVFHSSPTTDWGFWIGLGIVVYGVAVALHGSLWTVRLFRRAYSGREEEVATQRGDAPDRALS